MKGCKFVNIYMMKYQRHNNSNMKFWPFLEIFWSHCEGEREARKAALQKSGGSQRL